MHAIFRKSILALALAMACLPLSAQADQFDILKGREIRAIIGGKPGGGTDTQGRAFFAALGRLLPDTTIHIQTINGGAGAAAVKELTEASGDLVTISIFGNGPIYSTLLSAEALPYDIRSVQWLGSIGDNARIVILRSTLGTTDFMELKDLDRQPIALSSGAGAPNNIETLLIGAVTGIPIKVVPGFKDAQIEAMLMAGDADVRLAGPFQSAPMIASGDVVPVMRIAEGAYPDGMETLPKLADLAVPGTPGEIVFLMETLNSLGRPYAAAPNTDPEIVEALRAAFPIVMDDPELIKTLEADGFVGGSTGGADMHAALEKLFTDENLGEKVRVALNCARARSDDPAASCE